MARDGWPHRKSHVTWPYSTYDHGSNPKRFQFNIIYPYLGMDQYLLIPFLGGWTSIYQLYWCSPGVQGFDTLPFQKLVLQTSMFVGSFPITSRFNSCCGWPKPTICIHMLCSLQYIPIYSGNIISHGPYPSPMLGIWYLISHNLHSSRHIPTITSCRQETLQPLLHSSSPCRADGHEHHAGGAGSSRWQTCDVCLKYVYSVRSLINIYIYIYWRIVEWYDIIYIYIYIQLYLYTHTLFMYFGV